jgi:hypothetical protein
LVVAIQAPRMPNRNQRGIPRKSSNDLPPSDRRSSLGYGGLEDANTSAEDSLGLPSSRMGEIQPTMEVLHLIRHEYLKPR